ncbi:MAG: hypothetical protein ACERIH_11590 [Labilibaculum antarcticum]
MKPKNLPIKLFERRKEIDERRVEGGGSGKDPKWHSRQPKSLYPYKSE